MPESTPDEIAVEMSQLRSQALHDLSQEDESTRLTEAFREGLTAGLDFAYRVVEDYGRATRMNTRQRLIVDEILSALVSEHDMRSDQPMVQIRQERATNQTTDSFLAGVIRESNTLNRGVDPLDAWRRRHARGICDDLSCPCTPPAPDPGPTTLNLAEPMRVPAGAGELLNNCGCGRNPGLSSGEVRETHADRSVTVHRANLPCYAENFGDTWRETADDFTIPNMTLTVDGCTVDGDVSCTCGGMPGLSSGVVSDGTTTHRTTGPCTTIALGMNSRDES